MFNQKRLCMCHVIHQRLAKNLKELTKKYRVDYIQPVDMFPQTSHVEAVVRLVRQDRPAKKQR